METINGVVHETTYTYDTDNRVSSVIHRVGSRQYTVKAYHYYDKYGLTGRVNANVGGVYVDRIYHYKDTDSGLTSGQVTHYVVTTPTFATAYDIIYDANGNMILVTDGKTECWYTYDSANQLIREDNEAAGKTWVWHYDNAGNIRNRVEYAYTRGTPGPVQNVSVYNYGISVWGDLLTQYNGTTIKYDGVGNPLHDGTWAYTWEHGRELVSMSDGSAAWRFTYDANGMRIGRVCGTRSYTYIYNGSQLSQMKVASHVLNFSYDANGVPVAVVWNGTPYTYVTSLQGDVLEILDSNGTVVVSYRYDAWGRVLGVTGTMATTLGVLNPLMYRGYIYDYETNLYYLQSRYYNPTWGRFLNTDVLVSTGQGLLGNNMFAYCRNNPVSRKDASGTEDVNATDFNQDNNPLNDLGSPSGSGGGNQGLGVNSSYYTSQKVQAYDWKWQNSSYNQNAGCSNATVGQQGANLNAFDSFIDNPTSVVGKTEAEMGELLGEGWTHGTYGSRGTGWKYINGDKLVAYHPGGGRHIGCYYKLSSAEYGKIKVVGPDYIPIPGDSAKIIWCI